MLSCTSAGGGAFFLTAAVPKWALRGRSFGGVVVKRKISQSCQLCLSSAHSLMLSPDIAPAPDLESVRQRDVGLMTYRCRFNYDTMRLFFCKWLDIIPQSVSSVLKHWTPQPTSSLSIVRISPPAAPKEVSNETTKHRHREMKMEKDGNKLTHLIFHPDCYCWRGKRPNRITEVET